MDADRLRGRLDAYLAACLPAIAGAEGGRAVDAAAYSLGNGGKRIRPHLLLVTADMCGGEVVAALPFAAALELIHTYSLIHDDLPAMDNDDLRRGRPSCHVAFGEATAILAGDGLLTYAFELMLGALAAEATPGRTAAALTIARAAGFAGMVGGQCLDLGEPDADDPAARLIRIQTKKTGALIRAALVAGAELAGAAAGVVAELGRFADALGLAFQIKDDLLDVESSPDVLGKTTGKDRRDGKLTFVTHFGRAEADRRFRNEMAAAAASLDKIAAAGLDVTALRHIWRYLGERKN